MNQNNKLFSEENKSKFFAEIIESCLDNFLAQCWEWNAFPNFGSLVQIEEKEIIILGIVTQIQTGSMDPMRYPFPYQKTEAELLEEQPQIFEFLKTTFKVQITGFFDKNKKKIFYILPSQPCKIHTFVRNASNEISANFFDSSDFLHLLFAFSNQIPNLDELLLSIIKKLSNQNLLNSQKLYSFCQTFSLLTGNDYRRLKLFLKRIQRI